jgi:hypothetical protein
MKGCTSLISLRSEGVTLWPVVGSTVCFLISTDLPFIIMHPSLGCRYMTSAVGTASLNNVRKKELMIKKF